MIATLSAGLSCGYVIGPPVEPGYDAPFRGSDEFTDVAGEPRVDPLEEFERVMTEQ